MRSNKLLTFVVGSLITFAVAGCTVPGGAVNVSRSDVPAASPTPAAAVPVKKFTPADIAKLKWLEGSWRGTGEKTDPFFERYRFETESTLAVESFDDEQMTKMSDVTRYILKDGEFRTEREGPGYSATEITADSVSFAPFGGAKNSFKFQRGGDNEWQAILDWPAVDGKPARQKIYKMVAIEQKK